jgi:putative ABC transport system permease protein
MDWRDQNRVFKQIAAFGLPQVTLVHGDHRERLTGGVVTEGFFEVLDAHAILGRTFRTEEHQPGRNDVVVLSYGLWQRVFAGDLNVIGQPIHLANWSPVVIGVTPRDFDFLARRVDLWWPRVLRAEEFQNRRLHNYSVVARLGDGISIDQAQKGMDLLASRIEAAHPEWMAGWGVSIEPLEEAVVGRIRPALLVLLGAAGLLLAIACANVANLVLARSHAHRREIALRAALGAGRGRLLAASLTDSVLLSVIGGALGLLLAAFGTRLLLTVAPQGLPRLEEVGVDSRVLAFTVLISLLTALLFGLSPAFQSVRFSVSDVLKGGARSRPAAFGRFRIRSLLVVSEVALSVVLLIGAGLLTGTFLRLMHVDSGFDPGNILTMSVYLESPRYATTAAQNAFYSQALREIERLPQVRSVGATRYLPLYRSESTWDFWAEGRSARHSSERIDVGLQPVSAGYFQVMGVAVIRGRGFTDQDNADAPPVLIINKSMARQFYGEENPIGKRGRILNTQEPLREIVGVVSDIRHYGLDKDPSPTMYQPMSQMWDYMGSPMTFVVKTTSTPEGLASTIREIFRQIDEEVPVTEFRTMDDIIALSVAARRFSMLLLAVFALVALLLTMVGIYGVISNIVSMRTHEIGVRMALGARPDDAVRLVVGHGMVLAGVGVVLGLAGAGAVARLLASQLYGLHPTDPLTFAGVTAVLVLVALAACYLRARRAAKVDPVVALRVE